MESSKTGGERNKTHKHSPTDLTADAFRDLLEAGAQEAFIRPWHRLERGLRLNRIRIFIEQIAPQYAMTKEEKEQCFVFLQKSLDKKLLNTLKIVQYDQATQRITAIRGLDIHRTPDNVLKCGFSAKKTRPDSTRKKKKDEPVTAIQKIDDPNSQPV
jgi:hypothetical protein